MGMGVWMRRRLELSPKHQLLMFASNANVPEYILEMKSCAVIPVESRMLALFHSSTDSDVLILRFSKPEVLIPHNIMIFYFNMLSLLRNESYTLLLFFHSTQICVEWSELLAIADTTTTSRRRIDSRKLMFHPSTNVEDTRCILHFMLHKAPHGSLDEPEHSDEENGHEEEEEEEEEEDGSDVDGSEGYSEDESITGRDSGIADHHRYVSDRFIPDRPESSLSSRRAGSSVAEAEWDEIPIAMSAEEVSLRRTTIQNVRPAD